MPLKKQGKCGKCVRLVLKACVEKRKCVYLGACADKQTWESVYPSTFKNRGHYASECKSKVVLSVDDERQDGNSDEDCYFLGAVEDSEFQTKWSVDLSLG